MARLEDLSDGCLVVVASEVRWQEVLRPAVRMASLPDGRALVPQRVDPQRSADLSAASALDLLEYGAVTIVDLADLPPPTFALFAWHARAHPGSVLLLRPGRTALPFELHDFPVRAYETHTPEAGSKSRLDISRFATLAAYTRSREGPAEGALSTRSGNARLRRRREANGGAETLRAADRALLAGDAADALEAVGRALVAEPDAPDLLLRAALLHRDAGRWPEATVALERAVAADPACAPAWRELGIVRDLAGEPEAEEALERAIEIDGDYAALVALSTVASRRGDAADAARLLERAMEASEGQLNLVLPSLVFRSARDGRIELSARERERVQVVLAIRCGQAEATPPEDAPWSHFDAAQAHILLGDLPAARALIALAASQVHAAWERGAFARALDDLERAGVAVGDMRTALGVSARRAAAAAAPKRAPGRTFRAALRGPGWYRENVPCAAACPVGTDAGAYVALTAARRFADAFRVARGPNPFASVCGRVCAAPCEDACRRGKVDAPVAIRAIKRFLTETHGVESADSRLPDVLDASRAPGMEGEAYASHLRKLGGGGISGRRVTVVGGGPAGLACAHDLAFLGHRVVLYEASQKLGGMMRHGIPEYRLPRDVLDLEIGAILDLGVEVHLGEGLDAKRTLASLFEAGTEAVFLASGAGRGRDMEVEGSGLDGVVRAIDFLINVNNGFRMDLGARVVVVGGGNVAIDVARTARLGRLAEATPEAETRQAVHALAPSLSGEALRSALEGPPREVHVVARQPMGLWPAQRGLHGREEVDAAQREGVSLHAMRGLRRILGVDGRVAAVELAEVVQLSDERGGYAPIYGPHAAEVIPCDAVLLAVGQEPDLDYLQGTVSLRRTASGFIEVDKETLATSLPGVFAGGDAAFGPRTLIDAVAEGKRAARSMHAWLCGERHLATHATFEEIHPRSIAFSSDYDSIPREDPGCASVARRTGIAEVEGTYDEATAVRQAERCLQCHVQTVYDGSLCIACGRCTEVCPYRCLTLVPAEDVEVLGLESAPTAAEGGEGSTVFMIKDETVCVRCGLCAEICPTGAMTMERFDVHAGSASS